VTYSTNWWQQLGTAAGAGEDATYTHVAVGNLETEVTPFAQATYEYTPFNQLETTTVGPSTGEYVYNGKNSASGGRRAQA
jgi:hypothetical protein